MADKIIQIEIAPVTGDATKPSRVIAKRWKHVLASRLAGRGTHYR